MTSVDTLAKEIPSLASLFDVVRRTAGSTARVAVADAASSNSDGGDFEIWSVNLVYGELTPDAVARLLEEGLSHIAPDKRLRGAEPRPLPSFIDLGSGEGVPCLVAALRFGDKLHRICGIELLPRLHRVALSHQSAMLGMLPESGDAGAHATTRSAVAAVQFVRGSFLENDDADSDAVCREWHSQFDVVLCNGTCFDEEHLEAIWKRVRR
jgi:hypothetical protein